MSLLPLNFPELSREALDCCQTSKEGLDAWLNTLPMAHPMASQEKLNQLLVEFNELKLAPPRRLEWLTRIEKNVTQVCEELDSGSHQGDEAEAAQQLEIRLAQGYKRCLNDLLARREQLPAAVLGKALLLAFFKALVHTGTLVRRSCQFSVATPEKTWRELYLLYRLACQSKLQKRQVRSKPPHTCEDAYYQALLLAMVQAENLRRDEVAEIFPLLADWSRWLEIVPAKSPKAGYQILASQDFAPVRHHAGHAVNSDQDFGLSTWLLGAELSQLLATGDSPLNNRLTQHLQSLLSENTQRNAPRLEAAGSLALVLGLRSVHYHLSGRRPFEQLVAGGNLSVKPKSNPFLQDNVSDDPWGAAPDAAENKSYGHIQMVDIEPGSLSTSIGEDLDKRYPLHQLQQVNTSATGYCLFWPGQAPVNLKQGEMVAVQEKEDEPWQPAIIRWVREELEEGYQLGVELLPSRMQPCALRPLAKQGKLVDFLPGFLIPELKILGTPASVLTPLLPFKEGQKVEITLPQGSQRAQLVQLLSTLGEFNQFQLSNLSQVSSLQTLDV